MQGLNSAMHLTMASAASEIRCAAFVIALVARRSQFLTSKLPTSSSSKVLPRLSFLPSPGVDENFVG